MIGTDFKWIAGTPDHEDKIVVSNINRRNNDKQKVINRNAIDRINLLTNYTNKILRTIQTLMRHIEL